MLLVIFIDEKGIFYIIEWLISVCSLLIDISIVFVLQFDLSFCIHATFSFILYPILAVKVAVADGFGYVVGIDGFCALKVGNGA